MYIRQYINDIDDTDDLILILEEVLKIDGDPNYQTVRAIYTRIIEIGDVGEDFWRETFYDGDEFEITTIADVKRLTVHDLALIQADALVSKLMILHNDIDMTDLQTIIDEVEDMGENRVNLYHEYMDFQQEHITL
jgi:hypothetical protein